jgi:tetratricopeptide (TPR) repeat protein
VNPVVTTGVGLIACMTVALTSAEQVRQQRPARPAQKIVAHQIGLLRDWVAAVDRHTPGELDDSALSLIGWTSDEITTAWLDVQALIAVVQRPTATRFTAHPLLRYRYTDSEGREHSLSRRSATSVGQIADVSSAPGLATLREVAGSVRTRAGGPDLFYKQAAMLHADIAMNVEDGVGESQTGSLIVKTKDGAQVGVHGNVVHWEFGRLLLDAVRQPSGDDFVRDWYRATMAFKLRIGELDTPHFEHGGAVFPRDAIVMFLLGGLHEWFADPRVQSVADSVDLPRGIQLELQTEGAELRAAEENFRRALEVDPDHVEARIRHGRVLGRLGRHQQAVDALRVATPRARDPLLAYYAHLFLGAEEETLGRLPQARAAYTSAAALYPRAQAPRLGLSQLAHRTGDRVAARAALAPALPPYVSDPKDDPWWTYRSAPGRHTDDLLAVVYRGLGAGDAR